MSLRLAIAAMLAFCPAVLAQLPKKEKPAPAKPTSRTTRTIEGWTVRIDDRLLAAPNAELGTKALRFLEGKLADIKVVVPADRLKKLQSVPIVLDLTHGKLGPMQYHPSTAGSSPTVTPRTSPSASTCRAPRIWPPNATSTSNRG